MEMAVHRRHDVCVCFLACVSAAEAGAARRPNASHPLHCVWLDNRRQPQWRCRWTASAGRRFSRTFSVNIFGCKKPPCRQCRLAAGSFGV